MDADHYGWIFALILLVSPILFAFVPSGTPGSSAFSRPATKTGQPLRSENVDPQTRPRV
jgi:hypothetical protein